MENMPSFAFRYFEVREDASIRPNLDFNGHWSPSHVHGANTILWEGASGSWWQCDGTQIQPKAYDALPGSLRAYSTFSMFYVDGRGFVVLRGDATNPTLGEAWLPLSFEHDRSDGCSSYLTNSKEQPALLCRREDQAWVKMLLPDICWGHQVVQNQEQGALKGELAIFLALVIFAIPFHLLERYLPAMFRDGEWKQYGMPHGRFHGRGVMVEVYTYSTRAGGSSAADLDAFADTGRYYV